jgi:hypothetical protein
MNRYLRFLTALLPAAARDGQTVFTNGVAPTL